MHSRILEGEMAGSTMRFGLIGCGAIGELRAQALAQMEACQLVAVTDVDLVRGKSLSQRFNCSMEADLNLLLKRDDIEAVIVSTPPSSHAEIGEAALQAGKHVLCEKPLTRTVEESKQLVKAAEKSGKFLGTGFNYRFYPSVLKARELFDSGLIGELDHIRSYAGYTAADHHQAWLHDANVMGGGALRDNGIHLIDLTLYFLGEAVQVKGFTSEAVWGFEDCEDNGFALLRNPDGKIAALQASWTEWRGYKFLIDIYGTRGAIRASCFPMLTQVTWAETTGGRTQSKSEYFPYIQVMEKLRSYRWVVVQSFIREFEAFTQAVQGKPSEIATGMDGLRAVAVGEAAAHGEKVLEL